MAFAIMMIGAAIGLSLAVATWAAGASLLLVLLVYPLAGSIGCLLAGLGLALCRSRSEALDAEAMQR